MRNNRWAARIFANTVVTLGLASPSLSLAQDAPALETKRDKLSYAFGVNSARAVRRQLPDVEPHSLTRGFGDALSGNPLLTDAEVNGALSNLQVNGQQAEVSQDEVSTVYASIQGITDALSKKTITETQAVSAMAELQNRMLGQQAQANMRAAETGSALSTNTTAQNAAFQNRKAEVSYAFGITYANAIRQQSLGVDLNVASRGLTDALLGKTLALTPSELRVAMNQLRKQAAMTAAERNREQSDAFLAENKTKEGVVALESGLQYRILKAGEGTRPTIDNTVVCHYRGLRLDGTEFDSSYSRNQPALFEVQRVMAGWREALQLMPVGSKWQLFIPGNLAYWPRSGAGPNAALIFDVELISINGKKE